MYWPSLFSAARSNGQIFIAVMPSLEQIVGQFVGSVEEGVEIVVALGLSPDQAPVGDLLAARLAHIGRARAGIVGADALAAEAAEQLRDRLAGRLAEQVPERDVERRIAAHLGAGRPEAEIADEILRDAVDRQRVAPKHSRRRCFVHIGLDRARHEESLAETDEPLVGVDAQP